MSEERAPRTQPDLPSAGRFEGRSHLLAVRVYYEDTDFSGVVYHGNYLRFFERGRSDFMRCAGIGHAMLLDDPSPTAFAVIRAEVDFLRAARIDDALLVETTFDAIVGPRFFITQRIRRADVAIAAARIEACCISLDGRAKRPPPQVAALLKPFLDPLYGKT